MAETHENILRRARKRFKQAKHSDQDERRLALEDVQFAVDDEGCQWPKKLRDSREQDNPPRPCLVLNKIPEKIDQVEGEFRQLSPSAKIVAVDSQADPIIAEIYAGIIRHIEYNSNARSAYNTAHSSTLYAGRGAWSIDIVDSEEDPFVRDIVINRVPNALTHYWGEAKKEDKSDANFMFETEELTQDEFEARWPDIKDAFKGWEGDQDTWEDWRAGDNIRIATYWWKEQKDKTYYRVRREVDGVETVLTVEEKASGDKVIDEKVVKVDRIRYCIMTADRILPKDGKGTKGTIHDWPGKYIPKVFEGGKEVNIKGKSKRRGMVRFAKTPQQMYNYWSSSTTEQIALAPKSPYMATPAMLKGFQPMWNKANIKNMLYLLFNPDPQMPGGYPKRELPPQLSTAVAHELQRMDHDIMGSMGIYQASLGDEGEEKSGRAILARQRQGSIGSYTFTSNFETALTHSTKILIDLIPYVYDTERVIRIRGADDQEKSIPINARPNAPMVNEVDEKYVSKPRPGITEYINDLSVGKYDARVTIGPSYTTARQEALEMLLELATRIPQFALVAIDLIVKNMDVPGSEELLERAKKLVPPGMRDLEPGEEPPQQPPDPEFMLEQMKLQLETFKVQTEAERKQFEAQVNAVLTLAKAQGEERKTELEEIKTLLADMRADFTPQGEE